VLYLNLILPSVKIMRNYLFSIFLIVTCFTFGQNTGQITIKGNFTQLPQGGHLQGIQLYQSGGQNYIFVSGSSNDFAYYFVAKGISDTLYHLAYIRKMLNKPFKHAGGFQIAGHYLAVGVEDDDAKDSSKVLVYNISNPGISDTTTAAFFLRGGIFKESTAGAVGAMLKGDTLIAAIASWDAMTIDVVHFYFDKTTKDIATQKHIAKWNMSSNVGWNAYQSINLYWVDKSEILFVGTGAKNGEQIVDVYNIKPLANNNWQWIKTSSPAVDFTAQSLRYAGGTGMYNNKLTVFATPAKTGNKEVKIAFQVID
jgi:hypothetical protein